MKAIMYNKYLSVFSTLFMLLLTACFFESPRDNPYDIARDNFGELSYTVTYNGNDNTGGIVPVDSTNYEEGQTVTVLGNTGDLVKTGYTFAGWNTQADGNGTTYTQGQSFVMGTANVTLYARWTTNPTYTVTYDGNDNTGGIVPLDSTNYEEGQSVTVLGNTGNLVKTGYYFAGWNTQSDGNGTNYMQGQTFPMGTANVILYARWIIGEKMVYVPGKSFKTGTDDSGTATVSNAFWIAETEVTYELWSTVYTWATSNGYTFANIGVMGDGIGDTDQHPVTTINWRDAMCWCNAYTEYYNNQNGTSLQCVYYTDSGYTTPIRSVDDSSTVDYPNPGSQDDPYVKSDADGFRLPTSNEWELAARYIDDANSDGDIMDPGEYYPGNYASGADDAYDQTASSDYDGDGDTDSTTDVVWYIDNSGDSSHVVGTKNANALGLYDMSGSVYEFCFDWYSVGSRVIRGGSWAGYAPDLIVGIEDDFSPSYERNFVGFRFVRNHEDDELYWKNIGPEYWQLYQDELIRCRDEGSYDSPTTSEFGPVSGSGPGWWIGGVLAPNGKIYCIPQLDPTILVIDPLTQSTTNFGSLSLTSDGKWAGGVLAFNGRIYGIPFSSDYVLEIDPETDTATTFGSLPGLGKWWGGVLAPNGKIYGIPFNSTTVLEIDPETNTTTTFGSLPGGWSGGVLAPNGKIYGIPFNSTTVLEIDPETNTTTTFGSLPGGGAWRSGVLAPNGKIYGIPMHSTTVLEINPETHEINTFGSLIGTNKWYSGVLAPNGKIYGIPASSTTVLEIDPETNTATTFGTLSGGWVGGVLAPNGKIYGIPNYNAPVLVIDPKSNANLDINVLLSGYFNKY